MPKDRKRNAITDSKTSSCQEEEPASEGKKERDSNMPKLKNEPSNNNEKGKKNKNIEKRNLEESSSSSVLTWSPSEKGRKRNTVMKNVQESQSVETSSLKKSTERNTRNRKHKKEAVKKDSLLLPEMSSESSGAQATAQNQDGDSCPETDKFPSHGKVERLGEDQLGDKCSRKRKTKEQKEESKVPSKKVKKKCVNVDEELSVKMEPSEKFVGAHVSIAGGLYKAVEEAVNIGARAFGMFLKSQRQWASKPLADKDAERFKAACQEHGFPPSMILPHGSYLMNCGSPDEETLSKSQHALVDELQRCEKLGLTLFNFHPGSTCGKIDVDKCLNRIAESINKAHKATKYVTAVVENMSCQGNTVGGKFEELRGIIDRVEDKSRIGVCLDTCHAFAAGFDLSTEDGFVQMMTDFDQIVGLKYLKAMHLNDSKGKLACRLDRHENIGKGYIGKSGFQRIMKDSRLSNIPMILETPFVEEATYAKEIKMLYSFCT